MGIIALTVGEVLSIVGVLAPLGRRATMIGFELTGLCTEVQCTVLKPVVVTGDGQATDLPTDLPW